MRIEHIDIPGPGFSRTDDLRTIAEGFGYDFSNGGGVALEPDGTLVVTLPDGDDLVQYHLEPEG
jgi:hypothetical protein